MRGFVLLQSLAVLTVLLVIAQDADTQGKDKLDYRKLVEGLVSPNRPIRCDNRNRTISIPPRYDWSAQGRIEEKRRLLFNHCGEALPFLIEACTDGRYCLTSRWSEDDDFYSWSVGAVCSEIISRHVEAGFRDHMEFDDPPHWQRYDFVPRYYGAVSEKEKQEAQEWWRRHKAMPLHELQLAAFDWAIEKRTGEVNALSNPEEKKLAAEEVENLVSARNDLKRERKSVPPEKMWQSLVSPPTTHKVVPWSEVEK
jgi:hypothetical protein